MRLQSQQLFTINPQRAQIILQAVSYYFSHATLQLRVHDNGIWTIKLLNSNGRVWQDQGSLGQKLKVGGQDLSQLIRRQLKIPNLYVFDNLPDQLTTLKLRYH
ncbi:hypothetical protein [Bombilactobacillus bombi]|uniref:hypothetical protein n=1 Tax=Bombilactobacillus bombi TaxID=1303590 RepID=UPI0015E5FC15|nr:hypothetical protein [Bombilactobacillus bombi]MBA1434963.1 hypothetical protein [Bombilactobacillus bombi]